MLCNCKKTQLYCWDWKSAKKVSFLYTLPKQVITLGAQITRNANLCWSNWNYDSMGLYSAAVIAKVRPSFFSHWCFSPTLHFPPLLGLAQLVVQSCNGLDQTVYLSESQLVFTWPCFFSSKPKHWLGAWSGYTKPHTSTMEEALSWGRAPRGIRVLCKPYQHCSQKQENYLCSISNLWNHD